MPPETVNQGDRGLFARAVVVIDESSHVIYNQLVPEIADEPDDAAARQALNG